MAYRTVPSASLQIHLHLCFASFLAETKETPRSAFETLLLAALSLSIKLNSVFLGESAEAFAI